jgi:hypothetical protein
MSGIEEKAESSLEAIFPARTDAPRSRNFRELAHCFRRGPWENGATALIAVGVFMLMQPFSLWLYSWSFAAILIGTLGFVIVSHFPE